MTTFYFNPFALISFSSFLIMINMAFFVWHRYYSAQTKFAVLLFVANAIYSFFYTFEISFKSLHDVIWFYRSEYFGIPFLATFYLMFALNYSGRNQWLTKRNKMILFAIPLITLLLVFTNDFHHLFYSREKLNLSGPFPSFTFTPAIWYYVHQGYVIVAMVLSLVILGSMLKGAALIYRTQLLYLLVATIFPFFGYLIYQFHLVPFGIDPVSFTFMLSGIVMYIALTRFKLFDLVPIARTRLFEEIQDGVLLFDMNNRMVDFNQTICQQLNITRNDLGKTTHELLDRWPEMLQFIENNQIGKLELQHVDNGKTSFYNIQLLELEDSNNIKQGKLAIIRDVSDLIKSEYERSNTANKLDAVIHAMPDMMFVIDSKGIFTDFFSSETDHLFLNKEEVVGATLYHLFDHDEAEILMGMLNKCLLSDELTTYQYEMNFPGILRHYEARISQLDNDHVLVIVRDVSESNEMKQDLIYQSGFQKILMQLASRFIYISAPEAHSVINDALRQIGTYIGVDRSYIFRYDFENETMTNSHEWCSLDIPSLIENRRQIPIHQVADWLEAHQKGETVGIENLRQLDPDDPIRILLKSRDIQSMITVPMISQTNCLGFVGFESIKREKKWFDSEISLLKIFTGMLANLQEKITLEKSLVEARTIAEASNKLKTAFMNNISHEIRTPLNGIIGFGEIIANEQLTLDEKNKFLTVVQESSERLIQTIDDYLDISMLVTGNQEVNLTHFNVSNLIDAVVEEFTELSNYKNITLSTSVPEELKRMNIRSDYNLIYKIFNHLVGNSLKFTVRGSICIGLSREKEYLSFFVKDTGIGIAENALQYVFDSFMQEDFSSTRMYEGSGLGLSIVKGIVTLLGGTMNLSSIKGEGTTFHFTIPIGTN